MSSELNTLASGSVATSSVGGSSGVFSQTNSASAIYGEIYFVAGGAFTPSVAGDIGIWFLRSPDGGTTFETQIGTPTTSVFALSRPFDVLIALENAAYASGNISYAGGIIQLPWSSYRVLVQSFAGVNLPTSGNLIKVQPVAIQY